MSLKIKGHEVDIVKVRYDGKTHDLNTADLISVGSTIQELLVAVENKLALTNGALDGFELIIEGPTAIVKPNTKFNEE